MSFLDNAGVTKLTSYLKTKIEALISNKQDTLVSGTNIKTVGGYSLLGSGNVSFPTVPSASSTAPLMDGTASSGSGTSYARGNHRHPTDTSRQKTLVSGTNIKTINGNSILGSGDLTVGGGSEVSVTPIVTSGTEIASITVDGTATSLYAPLDVPWISFDDLTYPISFTTNPTTTYQVLIASSDTIKNASEVLVQLGSRQLHFQNIGVAVTQSINFIPDGSTNSALSTSYAAGADVNIDFSTGQIQGRQYMKKPSAGTYNVNGIWYRVDPNTLADANSTSY